MSESNKAIVRRKFEQVLAAGRLDVVDEIFDVGVVSYDPTDPEPIRGRDAYRESIARAVGAFGDLRVQIHDQVAEDDEVATRYSATGRHVGELFGIPATGNEFVITATDIHRLVDGRIVEEWSSWDALGFMRQLDLLPAEVGG
jgi:steroid delta-isomerase-like uncharacterized protein